MGFLIETNKLSSSESSIRFIPKTDLDEYLEEEINVRIKSYKSKRGQEAGLEYFNKLYSDLYFFINYRESYKDISLHFELRQDNLDCMDALIYHYITKEGIVLSPIAERSLNSIIELVEKNVRIPFLWGSQKQRIKTVTDQLGELLEMGDSKFKLIQLITFRAKLQSIIVLSSFNKTKEYLLTQYDAEIAKLEKLLSLGLLPDIVELEKTPTVLSSIPPTTFKIAPKKKTDFIKVISAMYDAKIFVGEDGKAAANKQELMEAFGTLLNDDFSKYSSSLAQAKSGAEEMYMKTFETLTEKAWDYLNAVKD